MGIENPYFGILEEREVSLNEVLAHGRSFIISVRQVVGEGLIVGQYDLWGDCILRLTKPLNGNGTKECIPIEQLQAPIFQPRLFIEP